VRFIARAGRALAPDRADRRGGQAARAGRGAAVAGGASSRSSTRSCSAADAARRRRQGAHQGARGQLPKLKEAHRQALFGLAEAIEAKDPYTKGHCGRVAAYALVLAKEAGYPADGLETLEFGAFLHDIGKIGIRDAVLLKPGPLDDAEWVHMREHPVKGYEIASKHRDAAPDHAGGAQPPRAVGRHRLPRSR
jgi:HD-GYP domain-containing protein (c-di-GMP phosphodiesterase class II)